MIRSIDWTLTAALAGAAVLAGVVAYECYAFVHAGPEPARETHESVVLIPARERPAENFNAISSVPVVADAPPEQTNQTDISNNAIARPHQSRVETAAPAKRVDPTAPTPTVSNEHPPQADHGDSAHNKPKAQLQISSDLWRVETTVRANYFNLGGHVDKNGVVDSLASSYLRDALKKQRNYSKLPRQIQAYIEAPSIDLAMIAGYRRLLGVDDRKMEEEQGVRFVKVASRGIEIGSPTADLEDAATSIDTPPMDLSPLERMAFDLRREMTLGVPRQ
jgi:hypothetical protein